MVVSHVCCGSRYKPNGHVSLENHIFISRNIRTDNKKIIKNQSVQHQQRFKEASMLFFFICLSKIVDNMLL